MPTQQASWAERRAQRRARRDLVSLRFLIRADGGYVDIRQPAGNIVAKKSGFNRRIHRYGETIHFFGIVQRLLAERCGLMLARKTVWKDTQFCHMYGHEHSVYLRTRTRDKTSRLVSHIWLYDPNEAVRNIAQEFNRGEEVRLRLNGDIFQERDKPPKQPNWAELLRARLEGKHNIVVERPGARV